MRNLRKFLHIADKSVRHIDGGVREVAHEESESAARLGAAVAADEKGRVLFRQIPCGGKRGILQQAKAETGVADAAADIEPVARLGAEPKHGMALRHQPERRDGDGERSRSPRGVAADQANAGLLLKPAQA